MKGNPPPKARMDMLVAFGACSLLLLASLANFLIHNDYPIGRSEVLLVAGAILAFGAGAAALYALLPSVGRSLLEGLLAALFVELNTTSLGLAIAIGVAVAGYTFWRRSSLIRPMALFGAIILVTTLMGLGGRTPWIHSIKGREPGTISPSNEVRPAIVHLILDEQIGIEGLPGSDPEALLLRNQLKSFYVGAGFATYGGAYSEHMRTANAIPYVLNYGESLGRGMQGRKAVIGPTKYLEQLVDQGYRLTILQSDYADFCMGARFFECVTYEVSSPSALLRSKLTTVERAGLITTKFLSLSQIVDGLLWPWRLASEPLGLPALSPANLGRSTSPPTLTVFDDLANRLRSAKPGEVYFAHLLLPHYPYAVDGNCRLLHWSDWKRPFSGKNIQVRQQAYYAQDRCTVRKIAAALNALDRSPAGKNNVVIIHGDHGSRISRADPKPENIARLSDSDLIAEYSTNFAVRSATVAPGYWSERRPIQRLLQEFAASGFKKAPDPDVEEELEVHLDGPGGSPGPRLALPASWTQR